MNKKEEHLDGDAWAKDIIKHFDQVIENQIKQNETLIAIANNQVMQNNLLEELQKKL